MTGQLGDIWNITIGTRQPQQDNREMTAIQDSHMIAGIGQRGTGRSGPVCVGREVTYMEIWTDSEDEQFRDNVYRDGT
jgi:hypothetical protein